MTDKTLHQESNLPTKESKCREVILGDCLEKMKDIPSNSIDMILTDLPYGVTSRNEWDQVIDQTKLWSEWYRIKKETSPIVLTAIQPFSSFIVNSNYKDFKYEMIWRKQQGTGFLNAKKQPLRNHESILVFYEKQPTYNPQMRKGQPYRCKSGRASSNYDTQVSVITENNGERYPLTVIDFPYDSIKLHPTQKPLALFEYLIRTYTNENDLVLDCCAGSGTTAIASINTNRNFIVIEKELEYFNKILNRVNQSSQQLEAFQ